MFHHRKGPNWIYDCLESISAILIAFGLIGTETYVLLMLALYRNLPRPWMPKYLLLLLALGIIIQLAASRLYHISAARTYVQLRKLLLGSVFAGCVFALVLYVTRSLFSLAIPDAFGVRN
jgi:hypothetical protein